MTRTGPWTLRLATLVFSAASVVALWPISGCAAQPRDASGKSGQGRAPATEPAELVSDLTFTRVGGFVGYMDRLEISKDGVVLQKKRVGEPTKRTLSKEEIAALAGMLRRPGLFAKDRKLKLEEGADRIYYTVRYRGVTISTGGGEVPADLGPVVAWCLKQLQ
jgi:hypothetical protein